MKQLFTLTCAALAVFSATAQTQRPSLYSRLTNPKNIRQHVASMLQQQQDAQPAAKTTVMKQRVIGESSYDISGTPIIQDSNNYTYVGYNGSKFNFNTMAFNSSWPSDLIAGTDYPYTFNTVDVMSTTMNSFQVDFNTNTLTPLESFYREFAGNNVKLSKDTSFQNGAVDYLDHYYAIYDAQGRLTRLYDLFDSGSSLDSDTRFDIYYDAQNRPIKDSVFQYNGGGWDASGVLNSTYNSAGNLTVLTVTADIGAPTWANVLSYTHTFYANNKVKTVISAFLNQSTLTLDPVEKDSFGYDPTSKFTVATMIHQYNNGIWEPVNAIDKHLNAQGLPDTVTNRSWNGSSLDISDKEVYTYNSYGNPVTGIDYINTGTAYMPWSLHNYYYNAFNDLSGVGDKPVASTDFKLYPNPAKDIVNISSKASIGKQVAVDIINVSGQLISSDHAAWTGETKSVSLAGLEPGIYWVRITDNDGTAIFHKSVLKQ